MAPCRATLTTGPRITVAPGDGGGAPRREAARRQQRKLTGKVRRLATQRCIPLHTSMRLRSCLLYCGEQHAESNLGGTMQCRVVQFAVENFQ